MANLELQKEIISFKSGILEGDKPMIRMLVAIIDIDVKTSNMTKE